MPTLKLPKKLLKGPFTLKEALKRGITRYQLQQLLQLEQVIKISHGIYESIDTEPSLESDFRAATLKVGNPSCVCLLSALDYYHLVDTISNKTWMMVPQSKRVSAKNIKIYRSQNPYWNIGIVKETGFWITNIERTLVESLKKKKLLGMLPMEALKNALNEKKTQPKKIIDMAVKLKCVHRVIDSLEAFV